MVECSFCQQKASSAQMTTKDMPACEDCVRFASACLYCERIILPEDGVTRYFDSEDGGFTHSYCYQCAEPASLCRGCKGPNFDDDPDYCGLCLGEFMEADLASRLLESDSRTEPSCFRCGARGDDIEDGVCPGCRSTQLVDLSDGLALYPAAYEFLEDVMNLELNEIPELSVSLEMPEVHIRQYPGARSGGAAALYSSEGAIWIQSGRPEHISVCILVHELGHAWQNENCPRQSDRLTEGFASWLEYKCSQNLNYPEYGELLRSSPCPVYGGGLRMCLLWEQEVGTRQFLSDIRSASDFPDWLSRC